MVSLNIDFYRLKEELRKEIITRIEQIEVGENPLDASWLLYALSFENGKNDLFFKKAINELEKWVAVETSGGKDKDLAPLSLCSYLTDKQDVRNTANEKIKEILERTLQKNGTAKFSVLNDPEQIFCASIAKIDMKDENRKKLIENIKKSFNGRITRKVLFAEASSGFGEENKDVEELQMGAENKDVEELQMGAENIEDVILSLWFFERKRDETKENLLNAWKAFEGIYPGIEKMKNTEESYLSNMNLAFLYEATTKEIREPDPNMLFDLYPIHPEIKKIARDHFRNKKYSSAIFQAIQKLKELIEKSTGLKNEKEVELVRKAMNPKKFVKGKTEWKEPEEIGVRFNESLKELSGKDEQEGLALITEGIFKAFRHPKGHKPEDHPLLELSPYEALGQLIIIDYVWKRIEQCQIEKEEH